MKVVCIVEVVAQLGTYRHSPDEVRGDFFTTDLSLPGQEMFRDRVQKLVSRGLFTFSLLGASFGDLFRTLRLSHLSVLRMQKEKGKLAAISSKSCSEM